jgi:hypothetical protein
MSFWERMREIVDKGIETSKDVLGKAAEKAKELGEKGVLKFEVMQLEKQGERKLLQLGTVVVDLLVKQDKASVSKGTPAVKEILEELVEIEKKIDEKEEALKKI